MISIQFRFKRRSASTEQSTSLAPDQYFDNPEPPWTIDACPKHLDPYKFLGVSPGDLEFIQVSLSDGSSSKKRVETTSYFMNGRSQIQEIVDESKPLSETVISSTLISEAPMTWCVLQAFRVNGVLYPWRASVTTERELVSSYNAKEEGIDFFEHR